MIVAEQRLQGRHVLVVEDEYLIAELLGYGLEGAGAVVVGPAASVASALDLIQSGERIDAAVLDMNLQGERSYPVADLLQERRVPFLFTTGYDPMTVRPDYKHVPRCDKPMTAERVILAISRLLAGD